MEIILYTETDCEDCENLKNLLKKANIKFKNKDLNEESENLMNKHPNKWEHIDLIRDYNLPPWVPTAVIKNNDKMTFVCSSNKTGNKGNIFIAEDNEKLFNTIVELID